MRPSRRPPAPPEPRPAAHILVADDNQFNHMLVRTILEKNGYVVSTADNGRSALQWLEDNPRPDAVLMDLHMPEMDGYEAARRIRTMKRFADLPIVALSAEVIQDSSRPELLDQFDDYVVKPFSAERLLRILGKLLPHAGHGSSPTPGPGDTAMSHSLPERMPGLDVLAGLDTLGGDVHGYLGLVAMFRSNFKEVHTRLRSFLDAGDTDQALALLHSLKGVAGNIRARALNQAARDLEIALRDGLSDVKRLTTLLGKRLNEVLGSVEALLKKTPKKDTPDAHLATGQVLDLLVRLERLLGQSDGQACSLAGALKAVPLVSRFMPDLDKALAEFDFQGALVVVRHMMLTLEESAEP